VRKIWQWAYEVPALIGDRIGKDMVSYGGEGRQSARQCRIRWLKGEGEASYRGVQVEKRAGEMKSVPAECGV